VDKFLEAEIPIDQYVQEFPVNHLDIPRQQLPETGAVMKDLMKSMGRFNRAE